MTAEKSIAIEEHGEPGTIPTALYVGGQTAKSKKKGASVCRALDSSPPTPIGEGFDKTIQRSNLLS